VLFFPSSTAEEFAVRVALVQVASPEREPVRQRLGRIADMCTTARGADLIVLPELWPAGYFAFEAYADSAEPLDGDTVSAARDWARDLQCHLHLGSFVEGAEDGRLYNTAVLLNPRGEITFAYRKIHLFGVGSREPELLTPGRDVVTVPTGRGTVGAAICYDLRFPELWRALVDEGAIAAIVPAAWPAGRLEHWRMFTTCRAVEEQIVVIACNAVGTQSGVLLGGHSRVVSPSGDVLVEASSDEGVTVVEVDLSVVDTVRRDHPALENRQLNFAVPGPASTRTLRIPAEATRS
jgi:predicted amidohydrolase